MLYFIFTCICLLAVDVKASDKARAVARAEALQLSSHPIWLKLLYIEQPGGQSTVTSPEYFLAPEGQTDSQLELQATINAYFQDWPDEPNRHPLCRFPGRYYWLSKQIGLPQIDSALDSKCTRLNSWGAHKDTQSVSLILAGGYLGNPASSFGHSLLKLNAATDKPSDNLFAKTINYGAKIPPGESLFRYITYGIFGGYKAVFSNQYFTVQDHVYSRTENRDMWEYELNLSADQIKFLLLHIWEISGREFDYYFFDKNCAYRIAQLVELASNVALTDNDMPWYLPETLFHNLTEINTEQNTGLSGPITFIPSSERTLFRQMTLLQDAEINLVRDILENKHASTRAWEKLAEEKLDRQTIILDTLLAYQQYLLLAQDNNPDPFTLKLKKKILLARLRLPPSAKTVPENEMIESPAKGNKAAWFNISTYRNEPGDVGAQIGLAAYKRDHLSRNNLEGNELVLLDAGFTVVSNLIKLNTFNFIRVSSLKPEKFSLAEKNSAAWQFSIGARRNLFRDETEAFFEGGLGDSLAINNRLFAYALFGPYGYSVDHHLSLGGKLGLVYLTPQTRLSAYTESAWDKEGDQRQNTHLQISTDLSEDSSFFLDASNRDQWQLKVGISIYF